MEKVVLSDSLLLQKSCFTLLLWFAVPLLIKQPGVLNQIGCTEIVVLHFRVFLHFLSMLLCPLPYYMSDRRRARARVS